MVSKVSSEFKTPDIMEFSGIASELLKIEIAVTFWWIGFEKTSYIDKRVDLNLTVKSQNLVNESGHWSQVNGLTFYDVDSCS